MRGGLLRARIGGWLFGGILEVGCGFLVLGWSVKLVSMGEVRVVEREGGREGGEEEGTSIVVIFGFDGGVGLVSGWVVLLFFCFGGLVESSWLAYMRACGLVVVVCVSKVR